jgi:excisionase family DNA binding protein
VTAAVLTPAEVAERVGATENYVRQLCRERRVPHLRVGRGAVRFTDEHLAALVTYLTAEPADDDTAALTTTRSRARSRP